MLGRRSARASSIGQSSAKLAGVLGNGKSLVWDRHRWVSRWAVTLVLLAVIYYTTTAAVAWLTAPRIEMTMSPLTGPVAVAAEPAKVQEIMEKVTYTGSIVPYQDVTVFPRAEGWVKDFKLYEGDHARQGELIARLDRSELSAAAAEAKAQVAQAEADLRMQEANLAQAKAELVYVSAELARDEVLVKNGAISNSAFDLRRSQHEVARQKVALIEARLQQAHAAIVRAREAFERRSIVLGYTDVEAPISGRVAKRYIYAGILVKPGMPIVDLQDLSRVRVQAKVAEKDASLVKVGTAAVVRFPALPESRNKVDARVTTVFPQLDPVTRTATVEVLVPNPGELIKSDMYAVVDFVLERRPKTVTIPRLALESDQQGQPKVFVTDGVSAMSRPVKLGIASGDRIEIIEGLKEGEMVVYRGQRGLTDGQQVNIVAGL